MTPERLQEIKARLEKTTPGPWRTDLHMQSEECWFSEGYVSVEGFYSDCDEEGMNNAQFIAHARQDLGDLVDELEFARREAEHWKSSCEAARRLTAQAVTNLSKISEKIAELERMREERRDLIKRLKALSRDVGEVENAPVCEECDGAGWVDIERGGSTAPCSGCSDDE